jgi:hypothetical protein
MGIQIMQNRDIYTWEVTYADGSIMGEYDDTRQDGRGWAEIGDQTVKAVMLTPSDATWYEAHRVTIPKDAKPVFFRRRRVEINPNGEEQPPVSTVHCIGWKRGGSDVYPMGAVYLFIYADGSTLMTDDLQAG